MIGRRNRRLDPADAPPPPEVGGSGVPDVNARSWQEAKAYDRRALVTRSEAMTPNGTVRLELQVLDRRPFEFEPGQYVAVRLPGTSARALGSPYCISSSPAGDRRFELLLRVVPDGPVSVYLGSLRQGDTVAFRGPSGRSMMPKDPSTPLVLFATGVGVGPFLSLSRHLLDTGFAPEVHLFWGLRSEEDICLVERLEEMARRHRNFDYDISLSQPPPGWSGLRGRITESVPPLLETLGGTRFYLCGNGAMIEEMATALSDLGVDSSDIHDEPYLNKGYHPNPDRLAQIRRQFVARDLFTPYLHREAGLFVPSASATRGSSA